MHVTKEFYPREGAKKGFKQGLKIRNNFIFVQQTNFYNDPFYHHLFDLSVTFALVKILAKPKILKHFKGHFFFLNYKSGSISFLAILGSNQWLMLTYFSNDIPINGTVADLSPIYRLKNNF